jgi:hypothetical protein
MRARRDEGGGGEPESVSKWMSMDWMKGRMGYREELNCG